MNVLIFAPHADDEVLGLGGCIARHADAGDTVVVAVMTGKGVDPHPIFENSAWDTVRSECK